ncbi:MAG TPA: hypothetical protein VEE84_09165 [Burkholderiaceae bacterium]|nr:hypothetical protein [Burkholderiaceae bacterium]
MDNDLAVFDAKEANLGLGHGSLCGARKRGQRQRQLGPGGCEELQSQPMLKRVEKRFAECEEASCKALKDKERRHRQTEPAVQPNKDAPNHEPRVCFRAMRRAVACVGGYGETFTTRPQPS